MACPVGHIANIAALIIGQRWQDEIDGRIPIRQTLSLFDLIQPIAAPAVRQWHGFYAEMPFESWRRMCFDR